LLARHQRGSDAAELAEAATIKRSTKKSKGAGAAGLYFIGEALRRNRDRRARLYLRRAIAQSPFMAKAWIRYLQALLA